jgi:hypothetical protein
MHIHPLLNWSHFANVAFVGQSHVTFLNEKRSKKTAIRIKVNHFFTWQFLNWYGVWVYKPQSSQPSADLHTLGLKAYNYKTKKGTKHRGKKDIPWKTSAEKCLWLCNPLRTWFLSVLCLRTGQCRTNVGYEWTPSLTASQFSCCSLKQNKNMAFYSSLVDLTYIWILFIKKRCSILYVVSRKSK